MGSLKATPPFPNIKETKEFTVSIVTTEIVNQVSLSSCEFDRNIDEFIKAGFTKQKSERVSPNGVKESTFIMECKLHKIIELGGKPGSGNLILGEIVFFHIDQSIIDTDNKIDAFKIDQIGRAGGSWYTSIKESLFSLEKPSRIGIGFDNIPKTFLPQFFWEKVGAPCIFIYGYQRFENNCFNPLAVFSKANL